MSDAMTLAQQYMRLIGVYVQHRGVSLDRWLSLSGVTQDAFEAPEFAVDFTTFRRLILDAITLTKEPALGLVIGQQLGVNAHGSLGYAAMNSSTIREVLTLIETYLPLRIGLITMQCVSTSQVLELRLVERVPLGTIQRTLFEGVICSIKNLLEDVSMGACELRGTHFPFKPPEYASLAREILGQGLRYDDDFAGLSLPRAVLDIRLRMADPRAHEAAEELCRRELNQLRSKRGTAARVRRLLLERRHHMPSLPTIARLMHLTPRTLHRRLKAEGSSYRQLLDELRYALARDHLIDGRASVDEIAYVLGYSDTANFRRAFKRWAGLAPSIYREKHCRHVGT